MTKVIAIIPARGGSKRLKDKNIYPLNGKPLVGYSIEACKASKYISEVVVSSDSDEILDVSKKFGAKTHLRAQNLSDDHTPKIIAIRSIIREIEDDFDFEYVAIIQANSPELKADHIDQAFELMREHKLWEVMSADTSGVQNAAIRIVKKEVAFQEFLSAHCGFFTCDLRDVHTIDDINALETKG